DNSNYAQKPTPIDVSAKRLVLELSLLLKISQISSNQVLLITLYFYMSAAALCSGYGPSILRR
ncbi:MAG: hypothetical protein J6T19_07910, partial [Paludibacteraceae bacterium]|nr:hypothetical protein [Paludibacteraceae bacterium]